MYEEPEDVQWWLDLQLRYGDFRRGGTSMRTIWGEAATRMQIIRPAVVAGREPELPEGFDPRRWKLLVRQEKRRLVDGPSSFSCACEAAQLDDEEHA